MSKRKYFSYTLFIIEIGLVVFAISQRQALYDWWRLRNYEPPAEVARLVSESGMNDDGKHLFYVHKPALLGREDFSGKCEFAEHTIVLGCYVSHSSIYIFDVDDERLEGVEEVTAAHEMLHAAYDRLSDDERRRVNTLVTEAYKELNNERIKKNVDSYSSVDENIVPNELHSMLGTEVAELPVELEEYYSQYFEDRQKVVALAIEYEDEFATREAQIEQYDVQLEALRGEIDTEKANLDQLASALNVERNSLQGLRSDVAAYNAAVDAYNSKVADYRARAATLKNKISFYNSIVNERQEIALEEAELYKSIDSRVIEDIE